MHIMTTVLPDSDEHLDLYCNMLKGPERLSSGEESGGQQQASSRRAGMLKNAGPDEACIHETHTVCAPNTGI